jgi:hypothetical protein
MSSERFLTRSWNNWLTVGLSIPTIVYAAVILSSTVISDFWGLIGIFVLGAVY